MTSATEQVRKCLTTFLENNWRPAQRRRTQQQGGRNCWGKLGKSIARGIQEDRRPRSSTHEGRREECPLTLGAARSGKQRQNIKSGGQTPKRKNVRHGRTLEAVTKSHKEDIKRRMLLSSASMSQRSLHSKMVHMDERMVKFDEAHLTPSSWAAVLADSQARANRCTIRMWTGGGPRGKVGRGEGEGSEEKRNKCIRNLEIAKGHHRDPVAWRSSASWSNKRSQNLRVPQTSPRLLFCKNGTASVHQGITTQGISAFHA